jgi:CHAD domain-containing protein
VDALRLALGLLPPVDPDRARRVLPRLARRALALGDELQRAPNDVEGFHALRRSVRNLRYAVEWLDEKTGGFKEFQDVSGRAADLSSALLLLDACPDAEALTSHRHLLDEEFTARRLDAVATWPSLRQMIERQA